MVEMLHKTDKWMLSRTFIYFKTDINCEMVDAPTKGMLIALMRI